MKYFKIFSLICLPVILYTSCVKKENYPNYPVISYNSFQAFCDASNPAKTDSAYLRINFTDGNGQIGYPAGESGVTPDYYIEPLVDSNGFFTAILIPSIHNSNIDTPLVFPYQIPNITPVGNDKELNGIIQINLENAISEISQITVPNHNFNSLKFEVWIYDLQGNKSNLLLTPNVFTCGYYH